MKIVFKFNYHDFYSNRKNPLIKDALFREIIFKLIINFKIPFIKIFNFTPQMEYHCQDRLRNSEENVYFFHSFIRL